MFIVVLALSDPCFLESQNLKGSRAGRDLGGHLRRRPQDRTARHCKSTHSSSVAVAGSESIGLSGHGWTSWVQQVVLTKDFAYGLALGNFGPDFRVSLSCV